MLAVPVEAYGDLVSLVARVPEPGLDRATDADVERQREDFRAVRAGDVDRVVRRRVVDDDNVDVRVERADLVDDATDRACFVPRGNDRDQAVGHAATPASSPTSSSRRRARCAYVCSSRTRSRARCPIASA